jgi:integrase
MAMDESSESPHPARRGRGGTKARLRRSQAAITLAEYADQWLANLAGRRPRTIEKYTSSLVLHILPRLGDKRLIEVGPDDIVALAKELREQGYTEWTVDTTLTPLKALFRHAVRRDILDLSPFHKLERAERPRPRPSDQRILNTAEIHRLLAVAPHRYRLLIATAIFTGLRQSELLALRWENVDFDAGVVRVRTALDRNRRHVPLKTGAARRDVVLVPSLGQELQDARNRADFSRDTDYIFTSSVGTAMIWRNVSPRGLAPAAEKASVGKLRWHDLRHTFASIMIANGANVVFVSRQLGHHSPDTTLQVYGHLWEHAEQAARTRDALDRVYRDDKQVGGGGFQTEPFRDNTDSQADGAARRDMSRTGKCVWRRRHGRRE